MRRTKIVATVGPASSGSETLRELIHAGVDVVRLNMSHADHQAHERVIRDVRRTAASIGKHVAILMDLQGPKLRVGSLIGHQPIMLSRHERVVITAKPVIGTEQRFSVAYLSRVEGLRAGRKILLSDGMVELEVLRSGRRGEYECRVVSEGALSEHAGVNFPGGTLRLPSLTAKDKEDIRFGLAHGVDMIALSFVRKATDVEALRRLIRAARSRVPVVAKIEKPEAVERLDDILAVADGVMVARGDLGVELSPQRVPIVQKTVIEKANAAGKLVITATQMLESMIDHPRPTRAEASDVANAIFDGTDAVMLSEETAVGRYPVETVRMMGDIAGQAEGSVYGRRPRWPGEHHGGGDRFVSAVARAACDAAVGSGAEAIMAFTTSGTSVRVISKLRPPVPIFGLAHTEAVARQLALLWGVVPMACPPSRTTDEMIGQGEALLMKKHLLKLGATVIVIAGEVPLKGATNMMKIHQLGASIIPRK